MASKSSNILMASLSLTGLLAGCAIYPMVGSAPSDKPPRIVTDPSDGKSQIWDRPRAFGPVPENLAEAGQKDCSKLDTKEVKFKAIGYHPLAKDIDGNTFKDGGYLCIPK